MLEIRKHFEGKTHIIWDWNGTLLNDLDLVIDAINVILEREGLSPISEQEYLQKFCFPISEYYRRLGLEGTKLRFDDLSAQYVTEYASRVHEYDLFEGVPQLLEELKQVGNTQSILSAAHEKDLETLLAHYKIRHHFDYVFGLDNHQPVSKVDRGKQLIEEAGIALEETILIGDTDHDWEVAQSLGIDAILVTPGHQCHTRLQKLGAKIHHRV